MTFSPGDRVLINRAQISEIVTYDEANNLVVVTTRVGGATDTATYHISNTAIDALGPDVAEVLAGPPVDPNRDPVTNTTVAEQEALAEAVAESIAAEDEA